MTTSLLERFTLLVNQDPLFRPRRIVTRSGVRVRGIFPSTRFNRTLHWESTLERDLIYRLESSWLLSDACTQPTTVSVPSTDGTRFQLHTRRAGFDNSRPALLHRMQAILQAVRPLAFSEAQGNRRTSGIAWDRLSDCHRNHLGSRDNPLQRQASSPRAERSNTPFILPANLKRTRLEAHNHIRATGRTSWSAQGPFRPGSWRLVFRCASAAMRFNAAVHLNRGAI